MPQLQAPDTIVPMNDGEFPVVEDTHLKGGFRVVADNTARDAIPLLDRKTGMWVKTIDSGILWTLAAGLTNLDWSEVAFGGGGGGGGGNAIAATIAARNALIPDLEHGSEVSVMSVGVVYRLESDLTTWTATRWLPAAAGTLYVDPEAGDDEGLGTAIAPLATIQEAINRFLPPNGPVRDIPEGTSLIVRVVYTPGMAEITESVTLPLRKGEGRFIIEGAEEVLATSTYTSSINHRSVAATNYRHRARITTGGGLSAAYDDASFLKLTTDPTNAYYDSLASVPITSVAGSFAFAVMTRDAFSFYHAAIGWTAAAPIQQVRPQIVWNARRNPAYTACAFAVHDMGGGSLTIKGFIIRPAAAETAYQLAASFAFLRREAPTGRGTLGGGTLLRCFITPSAAGAFINNVASGDASVSSCYISGEFVGLVGAINNCRSTLDVQSYSLTLQSCKASVLGLDISFTLLSGSLLVTDSVIEGGAVDLDGCGMRIAGSRWDSALAFSINNCQQSDGCVWIGVKGNYGGGCGSQFFVRNSVDLFCATGNVGSLFVVRDFSLLSFTNTFYNLTLSGSTFKIGDIAAFGPAGDETLYHALRGGLTCLNRMARLHTGTA